MGGCDNGLRLFFHERDGLMRLRSLDGTLEFPVMFCPFCGERIDYDVLKEKE